MFGLFKKSSKTDKLEKQYKKLLEAAVTLQRNGDIQGYALKSEEAEKVLKEIEQLKG